ncbi:hypothetical protein [Rhodanobacter sp. MP1X3]|uniref:hypothetical protein n=1 Tax=Rhodanobacter sp. MP1X3 TaxID=2723086 RepID=UPI0016143F86|nr:hypothetical protein [Rhodanobacter sp. MP1X3]MBB6241551.1 hypothetical protein [Rhodanobacter sp. MP1X3]
MRRVLIALLALLIGWGALSHWRHRAVTQPPGILAPDTPQQDNLGTAAPVLQQGDVTLTTRAHFVVTARVLSREDYSWDADAKLIPEDLALGWGRMSDSSVLASIKITQSDRFYYWHVHQFPIPRREIETSSANMHMIPADAGVKRELEQVRVGQVVHFEGFLVDASRPGGWHWKTSMTRDDVGAGACELVYVESLMIAK